MSPAPTTTATRRGQVLVLDPSTELKFRGPFTEVVTRKLRLTNPTERRVCFKVKSNAPHQYCVHPSGALIEPHSHIDVAVMLQPTSTNPAADCCHKFMVQSIFAPDGQLSGLERLWQTTKQDEVMNSKLSCNFEDAEPVAKRMNYCNGSSTQQLDNDQTAAVTSLASSKPSSRWTTFCIIAMALIAAVVYKFVV